MGWQAIGYNEFKLDVALSRGGTQAVFFSPHDSRSFAVIAPLDKTVDGNIPDPFRNRSYGTYNLDVIADTVVLTDCIPVGPTPPTPAQITEAGRTLTLYAEQTFSTGSIPGHDTAAPPNPSAPVPATTGTAGNSGQASSLPKGANISLTQGAPKLTTVTVGLGWDVDPGGGPGFDIDASAIACGDDRRVLTDNHFVFYNNLRSPEGTIVHWGDNTTGEGDGDDERIDVDLQATPATITSIFFIASIFDADTRGQSFGKIRNAYIRVNDQPTGGELARFDLSDSAATETAMIFGELYRRSGDWKFRAIGQGYDTGLAGVARDFGVDIE
ncbi:TerD family protein [Mycobacterium frederiksbergense]|nr:TerD family protein [Mycolicibacterium frederiksbergense]